MAEDNYGRSCRLTYMKLDRSKQRFATIVLYLTIVLLALINPVNNLVLVGFWGVISSTVCPLIVTVLPSAFFYYILKMRGESEKKLRCIGISYASLGIVILPLFLTLSLKNLLTTTKD
jgi:hypothetical protein